VAIPKKERKQRVYLRPDEYTRMLSAAGSAPRDFAILQLFLQTGIRVSELCTLTLAHLDLTARTLHVAGKGNKERTIDLEKKAIAALRNYLKSRDPHARDEHLFLSYQGTGLSVRGVQDIVEKYAKAACQVTAGSAPLVYGEHAPLVFGETAPRRHGQSAPPQR
jgi:site-specific recombinase XerC